ncbi:FAD-dependent oxidoreductase [Burkholderia aenigmatica]|uniref:FAD-dependent oxidoreductase n=1 Tax=Burkholderia aenigmatica TaxID=2015348 RepID=A0A6P2H164_9BURK|nr:FAD-binding oxidoreductase [Burkholderia aenigmatica]VWB10704.1 FAD-dependent oxidoreductase [Burkholderia aenigmatica]
MGETKRADVVIVGGGIVGCSTALWLAERGAKVVVLERGQVASEQSSRAWGLVRQQGRHAAEIPLAQEANRIWHQLTERLGAVATEFEVAGILMVAETEEDDARVSAGLADAAAHGLDARRVGADEIRALVPQLHGNWRAGLHTPGDAYAEPAVASRSIAREAVRLGVEIVERAPVHGLKTVNGRIVGVTTGGGDVEAGAVLLAAGIGTAYLARQAGIDLPIQAIRSSVGRTTTADGFTRIAVWGPQVAYRPRRDGSFVIGNGYRGQGADYDLSVDSLRGLRHFLPAYGRNWRQLRLSLGREFVDALQRATRRDGAVLPLPEPRVNDRKVASNFAHFRALFPHLGGIALQTSWAGRIDLTPDVIPIIDRPDPAQNLFVAAGFSGHGFALGPAVGAQMAQWIGDGRPSIDLAAFRADRFTQGRHARASHAL